MFEDKTLTCRECGAQFVFTASSSSSTPRRVSRMSPAVALLAVPRVALPMAAAVPSVRCMT